LALSRADGGSNLDADRHFDSKRQFLVDYIEKITYSRDKVTLQGSVSVLRKPANETKLEFKIERPIDRAQLLRPIHQLAARSSPSTAVRRSSFQDRSPRHCVSLLEPVDHVVPAWTAKFHQEVVALVHHLNHECFYFLIVEPAFGVQALELRRVPKTVPRHQFRKPLSHGLILLHFFP